MYGYYGRLLRVDLSTSEIYEEELEEDDVRNYFGGRGLAIHLLIDEIKPGTDPLGPDNKLVFATGCFAGSLPGGNRFVVAGKSPLTGIWGQSNCGGFFATQLIATGYDGILIEGASEEPVYLNVKEEEAELMDAADLWGKIAPETEQGIKDKIGYAARVASIGPAGERLVKFANIIADSVGTAGRCGLGAVMGSKKLKAIAVQGKKKPKIADPQRVKQMSRDIVSRIQENPIIQKERKPHGRAGIITFLNEVGHLPTKNHQLGSFKSADKIAGETMTKTILTRAEACWGCAAATKRAVEVKGGPYAVKEGWGPEYETVAAFGSLCLNSNLESIAKANEICYHYGMDTISVGNVIAFSMECFEKKIIDMGDTGGLDLRWGNHEALVETVLKIARKEGFGGTLSEGVREVSRRIGEGSERFACHVKGLEIPMHTCQNKKDLQLSYATSNRGACHLADPNKPVKELGIKRGGVLWGGKITDTIEGVPEEVVKRQNLGAVIDSLGVCKSLFWYDPISVTIIADALQAITGWDISIEVLLETGGRIYNLERRFLTREGITKKDDTLPGRFFEPFPEGPCKGMRVVEEELDQMLKEYYHLRGW